jgi:hypothetical protein
MENKTEYLSLYDFLSKPAGEKLGKEVWDAASKQGIKAQTREVSNSKFTGKVLLYPKDFLEMYFLKETTSFLETLPGQIQSDIDDDLPKGHDWMGNLGDDDLPF